MNQRQIGLTMLIIGILLVIFLSISKAQEDRYMERVMELNEGSCILDDGTCMHRESFQKYIFGGTIAFTLVILGVYLMFFDKTQKMMQRQQQELTKALKEAREEEKNKDEFKAFLSGFDEDEQKVIKAIKEQDGILQSTLRYRTGMSKTELSLMLKKLEERKIISRKESGKTKEVYLRKRF